MSNNLLTVVQKLDKCPPFFVYALARVRKQNRPPLAELVKASGIPERTFIRIARSYTWSHIRVKDIDAFCKACNVNIWDRTRNMHYFKNTLKCERPFAHLSKRQLATFEMQLAEYAARKKAAAIPQVVPSP